jgi:ubiquinone/menaquinone biosynthesis C-methylase UbiE
MTDLSYKEQLDKLQIRIRAHKEFANFDVSDWIDEFTGRKPRKAIFDLGCGNGNHLGIYLKHVGADGTVAGLDREQRLLDQARDTYKDAENLQLIQGSMDDPIPFPDGTFDLCFSNFAIYNARDPKFTISELKRVLKPGGEVVLIGPTMNNAREIYEYNESLTGQAIDEITLIRTDRLRREILPIVQEVFGNANEEVLNSKLTFPTPDEFVLYFQSTMVYEETAEKRGVSREQMLAAVPQEKDIIVSKEMLAATAMKKG